MLLALDQGTSSSRALVISRSGDVEASAQNPFPQVYPRPGWVEHDPSAILESQLEAASKVLRPGIEGIGIANQRETTLVWDRQTGEPIGPAIVWQDRRTSDRCLGLSEQGTEGWVRAKTGLPLDPYFSATKIEWLLDHTPGARAAAEQGRLAFGTVDTWLIWRLTEGEVHATDPTNASRTLLWNLSKSRWDDDLLELFRLPRSLLPEVRPSSGFFGRAKALGGLPILGVAGDQQAAAFGQGCLAPGEAKNTYGTGCFLLQIAGSQPPSPPHGLLATAAAPEGLFALEGSVFAAGAAVQWLRDELGLIQSAAETEALAASVPDAGGLVFVPAFAGLGAPWWDPTARGLLAGASRGATRAHFVRAVLEGVAHQVQDVLDAMGGLVELRVDGGMTENSWLMQLQADLSGSTVVRPAMRESTALGAAWLALASLEPGWLPGRQDRADVFEPRMSRDQAEAMRRQWRSAVERAKGWA